MIRTRIGADEEENMAQALAFELNVAPWKTEMGISNDFVLTV